MTDLISRADAIEAIFKVGHEHIEEKVVPLGAVTDYSDAIKALPSADAVQGEWVDWLGNGNEWECSICKCSIESHGSIAYKYCPMCGARMKGGAV